MRWDFKAWLYLIRNNTRYLFLNLYYFSPPWWCNQVVAITADSIIFRHIVYAQYKAHFREFFRALKASKLGLWWDPFVQSRKGMTVKFAEVLCHVSWQWRIMQNLKRNWLSFQNWHEEINEFWLKHSKKIAL